MKELLITMFVTALLFTMTLFIAGCTHLIPEKTTIIEAQNAAVTLYSGRDALIIVEDRNPVSPL